MERVRRRGEEERAKTLAAGMSHAMDPTRPWDWVWEQVVLDANFWRTELEEPALVVLARSSGRALGSETSAGTQPPLKRVTVDDMPSAPPAAKRLGVHDVDGNAFRANRRGKKLCLAFNQGSCPLVHGNTTCPKNSHEVHQCSRCLDTAHGAHQCNRTDFPAQKPAKEVGDKGKGKGKKGYGKSKRWNY